jgi:hypothetical protein
MRIYNCGQFNRQTQFLKFIKIDKLTLVKFVGDVEVTNLWAGKTAMSWSGGP